MTIESLKIKAQKLREETFFIFHEPLSYQVQANPEAVYLNAFCSSYIIVLHTLLKSM